MERMWELSVEAPKSHSRTRGLGGAVDEGNGLEDDFSEIGQDS